MKFRIADTFADSLNKLTAQEPAYRDGDDNYGV